jgi:putative membrane protein
MAISLTPDELARVEEAVRSAESATSGEIVPYVVSRSATYPLAIWKGGGLGASVVAIGVLIFAWLYEGWGFAWLLTSWGAITATLAGAVSASVVVRLVPAAQRLMVGRSELEAAVHQRATLAFVEEEVFSTRDRTGILLFVSLFERRIEVVGDSGINEAVEPEDWARIVGMLRNEIRRGRLADGLIEAVAQCGQLLTRKGLAIAPDDQDELDNRLRMGE